MKILVSVLFLFISNSSMANLFDRYMGEYDVVSQDCIEDGEEVLRGCNIKKVSIENDQEQLWLYTESDRGEKNGKSIEEFDLSDTVAGKLYKAKITGQEFNATWSLTIHISEGELRDRVRVNEVVNIYDRGDHLMYYYSYVERSSWKDDKRIFRTYKLIIKE